MSAFFIGAKPHCDRQDLDRSAVKHKTMVVNLSLRLAVGGVSCHLLSWLLLAFPPLGKRPVLKVKAGLRWPAFWREL
jgi:hypothetical protein